MTFSCFIEFSEKFDFVVFRFLWFPGFAVNPDMVNQDTWPERHCWVYKQRFWHCF